MSHNRPGRCLGQRWGDRISDLPLDRLKGAVKDCIRRKSLKEGSLPQGDGPILFRMGEPSLGDVATT